MKRKKGFTLIEVILVTVILAILSSIAYTSFVGAKGQTLVKEAIVNLNLISAAEKSYFMERGAYCLALDTGEVNDFLHLAVSNKTWEYSIDSGDPALNYRAEAVRGDGCTCYINATMDEATPVSGTCP